MFLQLNHQKLEAYKEAQTLLVETYKLCKHLPADEKFIFVPQLKRASLSVLLNNAEGSSRKSETERKRYFTISRGSVIEIDSALDGLAGIGYIKDFDLTGIENCIIKEFKLLTGLINYNGTNN